jgi:hypothetical protein
MHRDNQILNHVLSKKEQKQFGSTILENNASSDTVILKNELK